jgi:hypothetical protein
MSNIHSYSVKLSLAEEQKICELAEIASETADFIQSMLKDGLELYEIFSMLSDAFALDTEGVNRDDLCAFHVDAFSKISGIFDKAVFSAVLLERLNLRGLSISEKSFFGASPNDETFVYLKNQLADEAYDVFSQDFADPRVKYVNSFREGIRLIGDNSATFCLLPIEERGVRLPTVEELIFRSDSKINSVIPVFGYDGNADLKYALVSKNIYISDYSEDDDRYFEIRVSSDSESMSALMICAENLGVKVFRVNTLNLKTEDGDTCYFSLVLKSTRGDFTSLLVFLTLFYSEYIPVGIYKNLE